MYTPSQGLTERLIDKSEEVPSSQYYDGYTQHRVAHDSSSSSSSKSDKKTSKWNPFRRARRASQQNTSSSDNPEESLDDYAAPILKIIDPDEHLPLSLELVGQANSPSQKVFKEMYPYIRTQLRLAMKHGDYLKCLLRDPTSEDGRLFHKAAKQLLKLESKVNEADRSRREMEIKYTDYIPPLYPLIRYDFAPRHALEEAMTIAERAVEKVFELKALITCLHFNLLEPGWDAVDENGLYRDPLSSASWM